jgi:SAM-dependent methyltransferase
MTGGYMDWKGWDQTPFGTFTHGEALYYERELKTAGAHTVAGLGIGELGFGNGSFAGWVRERGGDWLGREVIPELEARATAAGFAVADGGRSFADACGASRLDLIVAFDVLEHLELPAIRAFLQDARVALKPGGVLLMRVPSGDSPFSGPIYRGDMTHRTLLGSSAARQLALEAGLEVAQLRAPVLPMWGVGAARAVRRIAVHCVQSAVFAFIRTVLMGNRGAVLSPDMIVVLRKPAGDPA